MNFLGKYYNKLDNIDSLNSNLLYFTYKINFENIKNTNINTDIGWGCTIRSTQMMLANIFLFKKYLYSIEKNEDYYFILYLFKDNYESIFSLHNFVKYYHIYKKNIGDWIGPYTACSIIQNFNKILNNKFDIIYLHNLCEKQKIKDYYHINKSYLVTFSTKLGLNLIDKIYYNQITNLIKNNSFKGIIGGTDSSSYYFVGITDDFKLIYLDPHKPTIHNNDVYDDKDFHSNEILFLDLNKLSPSMSFCFYFNNFENLKKFYNSIEKHNILNIIDENNTDFITIKEDNDWEVINY